MSIVRNDFIHLTAAKQFAFQLIEQGIQFNFCPDPLSISYPEVRPVLEEQPVPVPA